MTRTELSDLQWAKLSAGLDLVWASNPFYQRKFADLGLKRADVAGLADLGRLPTTAKEELLADQESNPPYGSNLSHPRERYARLHQTSGTSGRRLRWLDTRESWEWVLECWSEIYDAVGATPADRLFFAFSFGPFLGFWAAFEGAGRLGRFLVAGGGMTTTARLQILRENQITFVLCTPTYALRMADVAREEGFDLAGSSVRGLILAGEPGANIPATRQRLETAWGARVFDHAGMTEIGSVAIEFERTPGQLVILENHAIAEVVDAQTGLPTPEGEVGELILTNLGRWGSPLIRYRTGDLVRWRAGDPFIRLEGGILARNDDMLWIKGNNVYPSTLESIVRQFPEVCEFTLEVTGAGPGAALAVLLEPYPEHAGDPHGLAERVVRTMQNRLYFKPHVKVVPPGSLPRFEMKARRLVRKT